MVTKVKTSGIIYDSHTDSDLSGGCGIAIWIQFIATTTKPIDVV